MNKLINITRKLSSKNSVKNSIWIIGERIVQMIISFFITMISARYLGPSNYGILSYGGSFVTLFLSVVKLGLDSIIVKELIDNPDQEGTLLGTSLFMRLISSFVSIVMILIIVFILKGNNKLILITTFLQSISLIFQALSFFDYWFQSKLKSKYVSIAKCAAYIVASLYKILLLVLKVNVVWFALSNVVDYLLISIILYIFYKKNNGNKLVIDFNVGKKLLKSSYHFIITGIMVVIYTQTDKIMIGSILNEEAVGIYAAALTLHSTYSFLPEAIITSARPTIYGAKKEDECKYLKRLKQTFCLVFWICVVCSLGITILSKFIINLVYGKEYALALYSLLFLIWAVPFANLGSIRSIWIVGEKKQKYVKYFMIFSVLVNVCLNYILINKIGISGAAIATLITEIFGSLIAPLFIKETREISLIAIKGILFKY